MRLGEPRRRTLFHTCSRRSRQRRTQPRQSPEQLLDQLPGGPSSPAHRSRAFGATGSPSVLPAEKAARAGNLSLSDDTEGLIHCATGSDITLSTFRVVTAAPPVRRASIAIPGHTRRIARCWNESNADMPEHDTFAGGHVFRVLERSERGNNLRVVFCEFLRVRDSALPGLPVKDHAALCERKIS